VLEPPTIHDLRVHFLYLLNEVYYISGSLSNLGMSQGVFDNTLWVGMVEGVAELSDATSSLCYLFQLLEIPSSCHRGSYNIHPLYFTHRDSSAGLSSASGLPTFVKILTVPT